MSLDSDKLSEINQRTKETLQDFNQLVSSLTEKKEHEINRELWKIRSELEVFTIEMKYYLKKGEQTENWQKKFNEESKGTSSKQKALKILDEYNQQNKHLLRKDSNDFSRIYEFIWKLKEVISSVLLAYLAEQYVWREGKFEKENDKIFEI